MEIELLSRNIKDNCVKYGITVSQLEKTLGFSTGAIGKWGQSFPSIEKVMLVADYFHISIDELCGVKKTKEEIEFMKCLIEKTNSNEVIWFPCSISEISSLKFYPVQYQNAEWEIYQADYDIGKFYLTCREGEVMLYISLRDSVCMKQNEDSEQLCELWETLKRKERELREKIDRFKEQFVST